MSVKCIVSFGVFLQGGNFIGELYYVFWGFLQGGNVLCLWNVVSDPTFNPTVIRRVGLPPGSSAR